MAELLKNIFFTTESIEMFSNTIKGVYPTFDDTGFKNCIYSEQWESLELKQKMRHVSLCLHHHLPDDYLESIEILEKIAPEIKGFEAMTLPDYAEQYGMEYFDRSLAALALFTRYSSSEFAIRPYIKKDQKKVMGFMYELTDSENEMVRRFSSEGCRPRLPWAMSLPGLQKDPSPIIPILEKLKDDGSETVRKSVANNLNDISKDHPDLVINLCRKWIGKSINTDKIIKHGLRTLLKEGKTEALRLFGYADPVQIEVSELALSKGKIIIGENVYLSAEITNKDREPVKLRLEYAIYYRKSNGKLSRKVFQISEKQYPSGKYLIKRKLSFQDMTTRKHYAGEHFVSLLVNGKEKGKLSFNLSQS
jgi:3-methyladenine DNA glycosylase AlkC